MAKKRKTSHRARFTRVAKKCSKKAKKGKKGSYRACMKKELKKKR